MTGPKDTSPRPGKRRPSATDGKTRDSDPQLLQLDDYRKSSDRMNAANRRDLLFGIRARQSAARQRQEAFETTLFAKPAGTWVEAAAKAAYLLHLATGPSHEWTPLRRDRVAGVLEDLARLTKTHDEPAMESPTPASPDAGFKDESPPE